MKKVSAFLLTLVQLFIQSQGYTYCSYTYYNYGTRRTTYYRCSSSEYCCGTGKCCTMVYARWYLWFVLVTIFIAFFLIWWYYRYRYRPRQTIVTTSAGRVPVVQATSTVTYPNTTATYPTNGYPVAYQGQPVYMYPSGAVQYQAYGPPKVPPQAFAPPPSYESATSQPGGVNPPPPPR
ncbi:vesicular, overexpressed in cancer, prosurvival protein 1 [Exaiptasia diaphana]|uniref:Vesicular, overexpressed in cancer, prosurvival protein 1 n=1 Tax=Exaiptasia diaphana TaxID=2652724 RepID=A0A913Y9N6_EXADI|nr:vesicular, overexpressed in cancer, prosurvival protein 1 [Exaiptasia diaphana]KXJ28270.1 hypothetical protein AC249_AIPGENE5871 [Exaiptasia diaphana]